LKNEIENLTSENIDGLNFPKVHFFQPRYLLKYENDLLVIEYLTEYDDESSVQKIFDEIVSYFVEPNYVPPFGGKGGFRVSKTEYLATVNKIKQHIQQGDIYEMNYCMEFFAEGTVVHAANIYQKLNDNSPMPFSCYYKNKKHHLACASPERFLAKRGKKIISQPIKGTAKRGETQGDDELIKQQLKNSQKERSENVMIVDLVRNDLSRTAERNSVVVEELFGVRTFSRLHQMISTVVSTVRSDVDGVDVIKNAFPMGSMTGAPKVRAMQLIEEYEKTKRGLYSGAVGYITPSGDFDFNVVIRSILYNAENNYLSFMVGSAITAESDAEKEYEECLLKATAMLQTLKREEVKENIY